MTTSVKVAGSAVCCQRRKWFRFIMIGGLEQGGHHDAHLFAQSGA